MKKIKSFIICILAGAAFIAAGFLVKEDYNSTLLCSIGFGLFICQYIIGIAVFKYLEKQM